MMLECTIGTLIPVICSIVGFATGLTIMAWIGIAILAAQFVFGIVIGIVMQIIKNKTNVKEP